MTANDVSVVYIKNPTDLIVTIPALLGLTPSRSLVVVIESRHDTRLVGPVLRVDLPAPHHYHSLAVQLRSAIEHLDVSATSVALVVVDDAENLALPHRDLVSMVGEEMYRIHVSITAAVWTEAIRTGASWADYLGTDTGTLPDPDTSAAAAAVVAAGHRIYRSREELAATLIPAIDSATTERRIAMAEQYTRTFTRHLAADIKAGHASGTGTIAAGCVMVGEAIRAAADGQLPTGDNEIVRLAVALARSDIRDWCLNHLLANTASAAENLWTVLTREAPPGWRANPATLLTAHAFARGDGPLANIALDVADDDQPEHTLAMLLRGTIDLGISPTRFLRMITAMLADTRDESLPHVPPVDRMPSHGDYPRSA